MAVIKETLVLDDKLSGAMANAAAACLRMANEMTGLRGDVSKVEASASSAAFGIDTMSKQMSDVVTTCNRMADAMTALQTSTAGVEQASLATARGIDKMNDRLAEAANRSDQTQASSVNLLGTLKRVAGAFVSIETAKWLVSTSDQITQLNARLELMTGSAEAAAAAQDEIYAAAQRSRGAYSEMANLVSQLGMMAPEAFSDPAGNLNVNELVAFAEQLQKQMTISGASGESAAAAMVQLTQGLSSGTLRGEELNSVLEQTPMIAKTIADYMGVSTGQMREMASEGAITADVVKNAMLSAAEGTNAAFEQMPMTWAQVWTQAQNVALQALQPVLDAISWLANNLDIVAPIVLGLATALGVLTVAINGAKIATTIMTAAQSLFNAVMSANPVGLVIAGIAALVGVLYAGVAAFNKLTGASVSATGIITGAVATAGAVIGNAFIAVYNTALSAFGGIYNTVAAVANFVGNVFNDPLAAAAHLFGDFADTVLGVLQTITGAIDTVFGSGLSNVVSGWRSSLNGFIDRVDGNYKEFVPKLDISNAKMDRINYGDAWDAGYNWGANLGKDLGSMISPATSGGYMTAGIPGYDELAGAIGDVGKDVKGIRKSVDLSNEDLKYMVDVATRRYVNNVTLTSQTPVINVTGQNTGRTKEDREALADAIALVLAEQIAAGAASTIAPRMAFG